MTQQEIHNYLVENHYPPVSRRQVGYDIEWCRKDSANFLRENRKNIVEEYKKVVSNLEQLRAEGWRQFSSIKDANSTVKVALYDKIQSISNNILALHSVGDIIELEMKLKTSQKEVDEIKEDMEKLRNERINAQAVF